MSGNDNALPGNATSKFVTNRQGLWYRVVVRNYLIVPYLWYVSTNNKVKIMCDENIKSPQPYIIPRGTAHWYKLNKHRSVDYIINKAKCKCLRS